MEFAEHIRKYFRKSYERVIGGSKLTISRGRKSESLCTDLKGNEYNCLMQFFLKTEENSSVLPSNLFLRRKALTSQAQIEDFVFLVPIHKVTFKLSGNAVTSLDSNTNIYSEKLGCWL